MSEVTFTSGVLFYSVIFVLGGAGYGLLEILWRGYTHPSMLLAGGVCFLLLHLINTKTDFTVPQKTISGAAVITTVEFLFGCVVNGVLRMGVWDYSALPYNLFGQICPAFSLIWAVLSYGGTHLSRCLEKLRGKQKA